jgi:hypothetical protein
MQVNNVLSQSLSLAREFPLLATCVVLLVVLLMIALPIIILMIVRHAYGPEKAHMYRIHLHKTFQESQSARRIVI